MKKILLASLLSAALIAPSLALAGGRHHGGHYHGHRHHSHHHGHGHAAGLLIGAGIVGSALVLGTLLSRPHRHEPAPVYRRPVTCEEEEVWRRLPDGRIQTGTLRRCY